MNLELGKAGAELARIDLRLFGKFPGALRPFLGVGNAGREVFVAVLRNRVFEARDKCSAQLLATQSREALAELSLCDEAEVVFAP